MKPLRRRRLIIVLSILTGLGTAIGLGLYAMQQNINLFYAPSDIKEAPVGVLVRLGGLVVDGSVKRNSESLKVRFDLTDNAENVTVQYEGILPDLFREGQGIVTMGRMQADGEFVASEVLAKHDENYMAPEITDAIMKTKVEALQKSYEKDDKTP
ncbi:MAG: cytochrome c maturation protein CcmE [Enterobacterales bacterium]|nr:cytochrome c maturation protein CcmE [Enterobacterales bacterium]